MSKPAADRIIGHLGPMPALKPRKQRAAAPVMGRHPGPHPGPRHHRAVENCRHSASHQVVTDAGTCLIVMAGRLLAGNRNDRKAWQEPGAGHRDVCPAALTRHRISAGQSPPPRIRASSARPYSPRAGPGGPSPDERPPTARMQGNNDPLFHYTWAIG